MIDVRSPRAAPGVAIRGGLGVVGDDRLPSRDRGPVHPDSFTHGTSEQRARWFDTGRKSGEPAACDTFSPDDV